MSLPNEFGVRVINLKIHPVKYRKTVILQKAKLFNWVKNNMTAKKLIIVIVLIVVGLGLLAGGYLSGVLYQREKDKSQKAADVFKSLGSSKVISSISVVGEVTKISGRTVTLSNDTENFPIDINEDVQVYSFTSNLRTESSFETIKVGDKLNVSERVLSDGQFEISMVIILPSSI